MKEELRRAGTRDGKNSHDQSNIVRLIRGEDRLQKRGGRFVGKGQTGDLPLDADIAHMNRRESLVARKTWNRGEGQRRGGRASEGIGTK